MSILEDLREARDRLQPAVRGLEDILHLSIGPDTRTAVESALAAYRRRVSLLQDVLRAWHALKEDGYPAEPSISAGTPVLTELNEQILDIEAAVAVLVDFMKATSLTVTLGTPALKP